MYTLTHRGETLLTGIIVFHADGRWGVLYAGDPPQLEDIRGRRWRIEGDKLFKTGPNDDVRLSPELRRFARAPDTIVSFTADRFVTSDETTSTYTRIQKRRKTPNHAMERTPKALTRSLPLPRPYCPPVYVAAPQLAPFGVDLVSR
jgi:hypothetical protein